eukprot:362411-Chlamydomonas_euryale.AAC.1
MWRGPWPPQSSPPPNTAVAWPSSKPTQWPSSVRCCGRYLRACARQAAEAGTCVEDWGADEMGMPREVTRGGG